MATTSGGCRPDGPLERRHRVVRIGDGDDEVVDAEVHAGSVAATRATDRPGIVG